MPVYCRGLLSRSASRFASAFNQCIALRASLHLDEIASIQRSRFALAEKSVRPMASCPGNAGCCAARGL